MHKKTKLLVLSALLASLAIVLNLVENIYIPPVQFGIRFGIANIVSIVAIKKLSSKHMFTINLIRVFVVALVRGSLFSSTFFIGACGVLLSTIIIYIAHKIDSSILFTSVLSAIFHSVGQVLVVVYLYDTVAIASLFPIIAFGSIATGFLTGFLSQEIVRRLKI